MQLYNRGKCTYTLLNGEGKGQLIKPNQIITIDDGSAKKYMKIYANDLTVLEHPLKPSIPEEVQKNGRGRPKKEVQEEALQKG